MAGDLVGWWWNTTMGDGHRRDIKVYKLPGRELPVRVVWYGSGYRREPDGKDRDVFSPWIVETNNPRTAWELVKHLMAQDTDHEWKQMPTDDPATGTR